MSAQLVKVLLTLEVADNSPVTLGCKGAKIQTCQINAPTFQIVSKRFISSCVFFVPVPARDCRGQISSNDTRWATKCRAIGGSDNTRDDPAGSNSKLSPNKEANVIALMPKEKLDLAKDKEQVFMETRTGCNGIEKSAPVIEVPLSTSVEHGRVSVTQRINQNEVVAGSILQGKHKLSMTKGRMNLVQLPQRSKYDGWYTYQSDSKCWMCVKCKYNSRTMCGIKLHINSHLKSTATSSKDLQKMNITRSSMRVHKVVTCDVCGHSMKYLSRKNGQDLLKTHKFTKHGFDTGEVHQCLECPKTFPTILMLRSHISSVHKSLRVRCPVEGCSAVVKATCLKVHTQTQHSDRASSFVCHLCGRAFTTKDLLRRHITETRVHGGERKHPCQWPGCEKAFLTGKHLRVHERMHTKEMPYQCEFCGYRARQETSLTYHQKKHHSDNNDGGK